MDVLIAILYSTSLTFLLIVKTGKIGWAYMLPLFFAITGGIIYDIITNGYLDAMASVGIFFLSILLIFGSFLGHMIWKVFIGSE